MAAIRVLVVDDSALVRQILTRVLGEAVGIEVVGTARNGVAAIEAVRDLKPDVVTLDICMPEMDGLEALKHIVRDSDARVIMLSSLDDQETTFRALETGAVEFLAKPKEGLASVMDRFGLELVRAVRTANGIEPGKRSSTPPIEPSTSEPATPARSDDPEHLVVMAASTGGPLALERVFSGLHAEPKVAYLIVQHLPAGFAASFAGRLGRISGFPVFEAEAGMRVRGGHGYLAPHGTHMRVKGAPGSATKVELVDGPTLHGLKPSADPLFESAVKAFGSAVTGVVLTGMGTDGAYGMSVVAQAGGQTIAQDEETSVVWGMPGSAVRLGAAKCVVAVDRISFEVLRTLRSRGVAT